MGLCGGGDESEAEYWCVWLLLKVLNGFEFVSFPHFNLIIPSNLKEERGGRLSSVVRQAEG